jgi:hypothetical protein
MCSCFGWERTQNHVTFFSFTFTFSRATCGIYYNAVSNSYQIACLKVEDLADLQRMKPDFLLIGSLVRAVKGAHREWKPKRSSSPSRSSLAKQTTAARCSDSGASFKLYSCREEVFVDEVDSFAIDIKAFYEDT